MATYTEVQDRELDRAEAEAFGWSAATIDAELPTLFTDREWEVMATDPAFGYVMNCGHPVVAHSDGTCYTCEAEGEAAWQEEEAARFAAMTPAERAAHDAACEAEQAANNAYYTAIAAAASTTDEEYPF